MQTAPQIRAVIRFGVFEADLLAGELRKNGVKVKIQDLPFRALKLLVSQPNEVLSRDQFRQALWPEGVFVDFDHGISSAINRLRDALGDSADNPVFIETVERRGYRWIAPTHVPAPPPVQPGPVLVKPEVAIPAVRNVPPGFGWRWSLVFPVAVLLLAAWAFWPSHRAAKAGTSKATTSSTSASNLPQDPVPASRQRRCRAVLPERPLLLGEAHTRRSEQSRGLLYSGHRPRPQLRSGLCGTGRLLQLDARIHDHAGERSLSAGAGGGAEGRRTRRSVFRGTCLAGFALFFGSWKIADADHEFRRAIDLNPNNAVAHHWYATYLFTIGRNSESVQEIERAQSPRSGVQVHSRRQRGACFGQPDGPTKGAALLKQLATAEPDFVSPHRYLKNIYFAGGDYRPLP